MSLSSVAHADRSRVDDAAETHQNGFNRSSFEMDGEGGQLLRSSRLGPSKGSSPWTHLAACCHAQSVTLIVSSLSLAVAILASIALLRYSSANAQLTVLLNEQAAHFMASPLSLESAQRPDVDLSRAACSNRGTWSEGLQACSCFACSSGPTCADTLAEPACTLDASSGTPVMFEDYWLSQPSVETRIRASDHLFYPGGHLPRLEAAIRRLHALVGNAVTEGREIVVGLGSMQIINAALFAFSNHTWTGREGDTTGYTQVYAGVPYYSGYPYAVALLGNGLNWTTEAPPAGSNSSAVEVVCAPNNPDASMLGRTLPGAWGLVDHAYYWPHYSPITEARKYGPKDVALFTLSKLTGHAGSRVGWAIVADAEVARRMRRYIVLASMWSYENQLRGATLLEHVLATQGAIFTFAREQMAERWRLLRAALSRSQRFSHQPLEPGRAQDLWSGAQRDPSPAYLWLHCNDRPRDPDCTVTLGSAGIVGRAGEMFGAGPAYVRVELLMRWEDFLVLVQKLAVLASN